MQHYKTLYLAINSKEIAFQFETSNIDIDFWKTNGIPSPFFFQQCNNIQILGGSNRIDSLDNDYLIIKQKDSILVEQIYMGILHMIMKQQHYKLPLNI